ncbi:MAG: hypothetical protein KA149_07255 [Chitinophagales bacterium]|nr:hypothetical protein [Chitinophagales bacterium]
MKRIFFTAAMGLAISVGVSSCKPCQICTKDSSPELRVCQKDYANNTVYGAAVDAYQAQGYNCKSAF